LVGMVIKNINYSFVHYNTGSCVRIPN
jgi:hypothetical protein